MPQPKNVMEIFKQLDKSNFRKCGEKTCLAFAGSVFKGKSRLDECPKLDKEAIELYTDEVEPGDPFEQEGERYLSDLRGEIGNINLAEAARRVGANFSGNTLTLKVLGKEPV